MYHEFQYGHPEVAEVELTYIRKESKAHILHSPEAMAEVIRKWWHAGQIAMREVIVALYVDRASQLLCIHEIGRGTQTGVNVEVKAIIKAALDVHATGIVLAHNHPSGRLHASAADHRMTKTVSTAAALFGISCLDHLIINSEGEYYSFAERDMAALQPTPLT